MTNTVHLTQTEIDAIAGMDAMLKLIAARHNLPMESELMIELLTASNMLNDLKVKW